MLEKTIGSTEWFFFFVSLQSGLLFLAYWCFRRLTVEEVLAARAGDQAGLGEERSGAGLEMTETLPA